MEWPRPQLREFCQFTAGGKLKLTKSAYQDEGYPAFSAAGQDGFVGRAEFEVPGIVVSSIGARCGKAFLAMGKWTTLANTYVILPDTRIADPRFLWYQLNDEASWIRSGSAQAFLKPSDIQRRRVALPPLSEQRRIVEILDQADRLRRLRAEADAKADRILPALFIKMFGDPATNPMGWPVVPLRQLGKPLSGGAFPLAEQGLTHGEIPFVKVSDMNAEGNEWFIRRANNYVSRSTLKGLRVTPAPTGTIVFPKIGAAVATNKKRLLVQETAYDNNVIGVVPEDPKYSAYLFGFFQMFDLRTLARSTALPSIKASELARVPIPKPLPKLAEDFAARLARLARSREAAAGSKSRLEELFNLLMHEAFSGSLTASWREAHMKELLQEMERQAKALAEVTP